jgi:GNAT superfamily N-acetyltransferase
MRRSLPLILPDGSPVILRAVTPADREQLREGFDHLSDDSRHFRFLGSVSHLSDLQLDYLTHVDHIDHVAWGALDPAALAFPGLGVGRFIRLRESPAMAEFSLTVVDEAQGRGVGRLLLAMLAFVAPTLDIRTLRGVVGRENERMVTWMRHLGAQITQDGPDLLMDLLLPIDGASNATAAAFAADIERIRVAATTHRDGITPPT